MNKLLALLGVILILLTGASALGLLEGSGGSSARSSGVAAGGARSTTASVPIQAFAFKPMKLSVAVGAKVTWTNHDSAAHTATADQSSFDTGTLNQNESKTLTFAAAGTFTYHCAFHPFMTATVTVG